MKINSSAGFNQYKTYVQGLKNKETASGKVSSAFSAASTANTDKVTLSEAAAAQAEVSRLASTLSAEVEEIGSEARLSELGEAVAQGAYYVGDDELAASILGEIV